MKKLFTLIALFATCMFASAADVIDKEHDWTAPGAAWNYYVMDYTPVVQEGVGLVSSNPVNEETGEANAWYQYFIIDGVSTSAGKDYKVTARVKGSVEGSVVLVVRPSWSEVAVEQEIPVTTTMSEVTFNVPEFPGSSMFIVFQSGAYVGELTWEYIGVSHNEKESTTEWINLIQNGDASNPFDQTVAPDSDEAPNICLWVKEYGVNNNNPKPAAVEVVDGANAFVCHANAVNPDDWASAEDTNGYKWANQLWIEAPQEFKTNDIFKISFEYKASEAAAAPTQAHKKVPGQYLHWEMVGNVEFDTTWKSFSKTVTVNASQNGMWSIAMNLNDVNTNAVDFYIKNIKWEVMKLDEGWFVADDLDDLGSAKEMVYNAAEEYYEVCVGTEAKPVEFIKISTKRGNDNAFDSNCIKVKDVIVSGEWLDYEVGYQKIALPAPGVWTVQLDEEGKYICFTEGDVTDPDGITNVSATQTANKVIYNLAGQRVANNFKGIAIKNGHKVVVK